MDETREQTEATALPDGEVSVPAKCSCKARNNQKWNAYKDEIRQLYILEDKTLKETMDMIEQKHGFKARYVEFARSVSCFSTSSHADVSSERNWKTKLKQWKFEKNVPANEMTFMVAKAGKWKMTEGKDTVFFRAGARITSDRMEHFKKRKTIGDAVAPSPIAGG